MLSLTPSRLCYLTASTAPVVCPRLPYECDRRLPKRLFYAAKNRKRSRGRPKKCYKHSLKESLKRCDIPDSNLGRDGGGSCQLAIPCESRSSSLPKEASDWKPIETPEEKRSKELCLAAWLSIRCPTVTDSSELRLASSLIYVPIPTPEWFEVIVIFPSEGRTSSNDT